MIKEIFENLFKPVNDDELMSRAEFEVGDIVNFVKSFVDHVFKDKRYTEYDELSVLKVKRGKNSHTFYYEVEAVKNKKKIANVPEQALD